MVNLPPDLPRDPGAPVATPVSTTDHRGPRVSLKTILALLIVAAVVWFAFANTRDAKITLWLRTVSVPVWMVLLGTFLAGLATGWLLRRRRRA